MKKTPTYTTVVFDLDGTLVDSAPDIMNSLNAVLVDAGRPELSQRDVIGMIGDGIPSLVEKGFTATGGLPAPGELQDRIQQCLDLYTATPCSESTLYPGVMSGLQTLQRMGVSMAVCTNKAERIARQVLHGLGIDGFFPVVVGGDTLEVKKPDARHLSHTCSELNKLSSNPVDETALASSVLMVGDSYNDVLVSNNADIPVAFMTYGYNSASLEALKIAFYADTFDQLMTTLAPAS